MGQPNSQTIAAKVLGVDRGSDLAVLRVEGKNLPAPIKVGTASKLVETHDGKGSIRMKQTYTGLRLNVQVDKESITGGGKFTPVLKSLNGKSQEVEMDADGALANAKFDLRVIPRVHQANAEDVTDQVVQSLPLLAVALPEETLKPLQKWKADRQFKAGPLGYSLPARARVEYQYMGLRTQGTRTDAVIEMKGTLSGVGADSDRVGGTLQGLYFVSPESGEVVQSSVTLKVDMDVRGPGGAVRLFGELATSLRRSPLVAKKPVPPKKG